jgi:hypothetical protein
MGIEYDKKSARLIDFVSVEDAEGLLDWLQKTPKGKLDLSACTHLHAANLQVLMAAKPTVAVWPNNEELAGWLKNALEAV